jgi:N-terminal half of MaoC dehydratase
MPIDQSLIGKSSEPQTFLVSREAVERFMEATEDPALQSGKPVEYAPPTFSTTFRIAIPGLELDATKMQLLHGEQVYDYTRPLRIGEEVTCVARITDVSERDGRSGPMIFIVRELVGTDSKQKHIFTARSTSIVRMR